MKPTKVVILGTGGTIAGTAAQATDNLGYTAAQIGIQELVLGIPALGTLLNGGENLLVEQVAQIDSKDMSFAVWMKLIQRVAHFLAREEVKGIVITHGTDTLEETAYLLQALLSPEKPVVLTCAMRPATSILADGPQNIVDAVRVACHAGAQGVTAVCAGVIHSAYDVQKIHTYRLDAFSSGDAGAIGYIEDNAVILKRNWPIALVNTESLAIKIIAEQASVVWPWVEILTGSAGAGGKAVRALCEAGVQGLVIAATGNGTLHEAMAAELLKAQVSGIAVVRATRCAKGRVMPGAANAFPDSQGLSPVKARIALMLELMRTQV